MSDITPTQELDCRGMRGSQVVSRTEAALDRLAGGDVLKVVATDPGSVADLKAFSRRTGHELLGATANDGVYSHLIRRKG